MANLIYEEGNLVFDDYTKDNNSFWVEVCDECYEKYKSAPGGKCDDGDTASGICSVKGCGNAANYYVDFSSEEVNVKN